MTRNVTLAVDDEVLARYRDLAMRNKSSVNAMIRRHMEEAVGAQSAERRAAIARMAARSKNAPRAVETSGAGRAGLWDRGSHD